MIKVKNRWCRKEMTKNNAVNLTPLIARNQLGPSETGSSTSVSRCVPVQARMFAALVQMSLRLPLTRGVLVTVCDGQGAVQGPVQPGEHLQYFHTRKSGPLASDG